jgi:hypothetical protein
MAKSAAVPHLKMHTYWLPNLLTAFNLFCGLLAILLALETHASGAQDYAEYALSAWLLLAAMVFDFIDGKVARWTNTVSQFGGTPEEIFVCYEEVKSIVGAEDMKTLPLGALGIFSYAEKIRVGLQQLMAGARCFSVPAITRKELMSLTEECAKVTGIPYLMDAYRDEAMAILNG